MPRDRLATIRGVCTARNRDKTKIAIDSWLVVIK